MFPRVIFLNSNLPERRYKIFKKKADIDELPDDSTDLFQLNMLDRYLDRLARDFENGKYKIIDQLFFVEFLSQSKGCSSNDFQPVDLYDALMQSSHAEAKFPKIIPLVSLKEKLKCQKVKTVLRYHQPSPQNHIEQYWHHLIFAFYPFCHKEHLIPSVNKATYFTQLQEAGVMHIINRNKFVMEPFSEMDEKASLNFHTHVVNPDSFS